MTIPEDGFCPHCGAELDDDATVCPECGSCEDTGWSDRARYENIGVPYEDDFQYEEFVAEEFGSGKKNSDSMKWVWIVVAVFLILLMLKWSF